MKKIKCAVCGHDMYVSENARAGVCSECISNGRFFAWMRARRAQGQTSLIDKPVRKRKTKKEYQGSSTVKEGKSKSRSAVIEELLVRGLTSGEVLAKLKTLYPDVKEQVLKNHISAKRSVLKKKGLLKETVVLSKRA